MNGLVDWFKSLDQGSKRKLAFAVAALALLGVWLLGRSDTVPAQPELEISIPSGTVMLHVVGEVQSPGVYKLEIGSRVHDAIQAAGGFTEAALQHSVNLARLVSDGEQLVVLSEDQVSVAASEEKLVSINRASAAELERLPGIGPALAERIVEHRKSVGSFSTIDQLRQVGGIGEKLFSRIKDQLML
jgi:competence protein ComEA